MKVLHVIPSISTVRGGTSRAVLDMVLALQAAGITADIVTTNDHGREVLPVALNQRTLYEQVPVYFFPKLSVGSLPLQKFKFSNALTKWLWRNIDSYDLVHIHGLFSYPSTVAMLIARLRKVPYITIPHGLLCQWSLQQGARKKALFMRLIERGNLGSSSALHLTSLKEQQEVEALNLASPSFVLPLGLNLPTPISQASARLRATFNITDSAPIILFMGRFHYKKGLDYLIPALGRLKHTPFHFVLAGSGDPDYERELDRLIASAGIQRNTYRPGFVEDEMKDTLLQGADLFALTSHSENFGIAVLESLAAGVPVLLTPGVALSEMVAEKQFGYITELSVDAIYEALVRALEDPEANAATGRRAQAFLREHYAWKAIAHRLVQTYSTTLRHRNSLQHA